MDYKPINNSCMGCCNPVLDQVLNHGTVKSVGAMETAKGQSN